MFCNVCLVPSHILTSEKINEEQGVYQSNFNEPVEEKNEHGEDVEGLDRENDNLKEELPDLMNDISIDVKDNILAYCADDVRSPQMLLSELLDLEAE